jgi:hypothetical protein
VEEATSEDLSFPNRSSKESDKVGPEDCLRKLKSVDSVKNCSASGLIRVDAGKV